MADSDYDDDDYSFTGYSDDEIEEYEPDSLLGDALPNGHAVDEEDVNADKYEENLYEKPEQEEDEEEEKEIESDEEFEEVEVIPEEKKKEKAKIVPSELRKTFPYMTKFEYSYLISQRALAIEHGSPLMIPDTSFIHSIDISKEETEKGLNPIIIQRPLPNGSFEEWKCSELKIPFAYRSI
jgi:DNA-directed RNA polymerase I, II, and III subunit RPABC2